MSVGRYGTPPPGLIEDEPSANDPVDRTPPADLVKGAPSASDPADRTQPPGVIQDEPAAHVSANAVRQFSPLIPGSDDLADVAPASLAGFTMIAPPGTIERRAAIARMLKALAPDAPFTVAAPKDKGGGRLGTELAAFGVTGHEEGRRHHRIVTARRPTTLTGLDDAITAAAPRLIEALGLWSEPGIFSWDRLDPGSAALLKVLPALYGTGADLGCGIGVLSRAILAAPKVRQLTLIDIDRRAVNAARRNIADPRAIIRWADVRAPDPSLANLDFVVMNPPFHDGGIEDKALGQAFIQRAASALRKGGQLFLVANRHLPYEDGLKALFTSSEPVAASAGFKIYRAVR